MSVVARFVVLLTVVVFSSGCVLLPFVFDDDGQIDPRAPIENDDEGHWLVTLERAEIHALDPRTGRAWDTLGGLPDPCIMVFDEWGYNTDFTAILWNDFKPGWSHTIDWRFRKEELSSVRLMILDEEEEGEDDDEDSGDDTSGDDTSDDESSDDDSSDDGWDDDSSDDEGYDEPDLIADLELNLMPDADAPQIFTITPKPGEAFDNLVIRVAPMGLETNQTP